MNKNWYNFISNFFLPLVKLENFCPGPVPARGRQMNPNPNTRFLGLNSEKSWDWDFGIGTEIYLPNPGYERSITLYEFF